MHDPRKELSRLWCTLLARLGERRSSHGGAVTTLYNQSFLPWKERPEVTHLDDPVTWRRDIWLIQPFHLHPGCAWGLYNPSRLSEFFAPTWHLGDNWHVHNESDPWDPDQLRNQINSSFMSLCQQNYTGFRKVNPNFKLCNCKLNCTYCCDECRWFISIEA